MAWKVELSATARLQLKELDNSVSRRILKFINERLGKRDDSLEIGARLHGTLSEFWKYRVGDYRLICALEHETLVVVVLRIGHRREIYKQ